jgi:hypothetical protein
LLAHGRWFSSGTPASSTTKTGRHDIAEILLKVALKGNKSNQIKSFMEETICEDDRHRKTIENVWKRKLRTYKPHLNISFPSK